MSQPQQLRSAPTVSNAGHEEVPADSNPITIHMRQVKDSNSTELPLLPMLMPLIIQYAFEYPQACSSMDLSWNENMMQFWERQFPRGILHYTPPPESSEVVLLPFSNLTDGTFDLSTCGNAGTHLRITTSPNSFFEVKGANENKLVVLIGYRNFIARGIFSPEHPFGSLMERWDGDQAPVGIFWRWGNAEALTWFDHLTTAPITFISSMNLFDNWTHGSAMGTRGSTILEPKCARNFMFVLNQNKD